MVKIRIKIKELYQNQKKGLNQPVSFALMATALSSCGGGGGGSGSTTQNVNYTGAVVKGPLQNALVFLDTNGNNIKDALEVGVPKRQLFLQNLKNKQITYLKNWKKMEG